MGKRHWIAGIGLVGCLYDNFDVFRTKEQAIGWLADSVEGMTTYGERELGKFGYLSLYSGRLDTNGNMRERWKTADGYPSAETSLHYAEVKQCTCDHPQEHSELNVKEWEEYWGD